LFHNHLIYYAPTRSSAGRRTQMGPMPDNPHENTYPVFVSWCFWVALLGWVHP
jgi:hypothetical protein